MKFVGAVSHEQVPEELRQLDIYVALSRAESESFGVAIIEASACGLPVVVSNVGGLPEVVKDGVTGHVVPKENAHAAADMIDKLIRDSELSRGLGEAGRAFVQEHYAWEHCVDRMLSVLNSVNQERA